jgi:hypothetical protein
LIGVFLSLIFYDRARKDYLGWLERFYFILENNNVADFISMFW